MLEARKSFLNVMLQVLLLPSLAGGLVQHYCPHRSLSNLKQGFELLTKLDRQEQNHNSHVSGIPQTFSISVLPEKAHTYQDPSG